MLKLSLIKISRNEQAWAEMDKHMLIRFCLYFCIWGGPPCLGGCFRKSRLWNILAASPTRCWREFCDRRHRTSHRACEKSGNLGTTKFGHWGFHETEFRNDANDLLLSCRLLHSIHLGGEIHWIRAAESAKRWRCCRCCLWCFSKANSLSCNSALQRPCHSPTPRSA